MIAFQYILLLLLAGAIWILYSYSSTCKHDCSGYDKCDFFIANANISNNAPMNFSYLTNKNYANNILHTYYLDDDKKINNQRVVNHPYMYTYDKNYGIYWWSPIRSNTIYNSYGVRI